MFGGYDRYRLLPAYAALGRIPGLGGLGRGLARALDGRIPARPRRFLEALSRRPEESYGRTISYFTPEQKLHVYSDEMRERVGRLDTYGLLDARYAESDAPDLVARTLDVDVGTYLPGDLLVKVDIATMAVSLEGRSPLLDHPLAEFAARLPTELKVGPGGGKRVLREAVRDLLPESILTRRKKGFGVPVARWLRGELRGMLEDALFSAQARARPFFRESAVRGLFDEHLAGRDRSNQLWALLMLELWCRRFLDGTAR
jgi:asparagine synthase (glutamine-hydrolysing)